MSSPTIKVLKRWLQVDNIWKIVVTSWFNEVSSYTPLSWFPTSAPIDMNPLGFLKDSNITISFESLKPSPLQLVRYSSYCCWFWDVLRKTWMHSCIFFVNELCGVLLYDDPSFIPFILDIFTPSSFSQYFCCNKVWHVFYLPTHGVSFASCNSHNNLNHVLLVVVFFFFPPFPSCSVFGWWLGGCVCNYV